MNTIKKIVAGLPLLAMIGLMIGAPATVTPTAAAPLHPAALSAGGSYSVGYYHHHRHHRRPPPPHHHGGLTIKL